MLNQIEGILVSIDEIKFEGMELLEKELGSIASDDESFSNDSLEMNIKRVPNKYRKRNQQKIAGRRFSTGSYQKGAADLKNDQTNSNNGASKLSGGSLHPKVTQRRFSSRAA